MEEDKEEEVEVCIGDIVQFVINPDIKCMVVDFSYDNQEFEITYFNEGLKINCVVKPFEIQKLNKNIGNNLNKYNQLYS